MQHRELRRRVALRKHPQSRQFRPRKDRQPLRKHPRRWASRARRDRPPKARQAPWKSSPHRLSPGSSRRPVNAAIAKLPPSRQRALAVALFVVAIAIALSVLLLPVILLHKHYDDAIAELTDRLSRYSRVAAQAPEYRKALDAIREKDGRRFFLKNTAPNLAGAELQELVRAAIEGNAGRITTSQNQAPRDEGRFKQITVTVQFFASTPALQKILFALEARPPYLAVENMTLRPL